jgi:uncharacterized repeat protein (TIGR01451 family)
MVVSTALAFSVGNVDGVWDWIDGVGGGSPGTPETITDVIGVVGNWSAGPGGSDQTRLRNNTVCAGDPDGDSAFAEWTSTADTPTWGGLGSYTGCTSATSLFFSEYLYDEIKKGNNDYIGIEIYNGTGATVDLSAYSLRLYTTDSSFTTVALNNVNLVNGDVYVLVSDSAAGLVEEDQAFTDGDNYRTVVLYKEGVAAVEDGGAQCSRWATGPGNSPTAWSNYTPAIQTPPDSDENQVRYGRDAIWTGTSGKSQSCANTPFDQQSGFGFDGNNGPISPASNTPFYLGKFTHYNNQVYSTDDNGNNPNPFGYVDLSITVPLTCDNVNPPVPADPPIFTFTPRFTLDETSNTAGTCVYPGTSICPDKITVSQIGSALTFTCPDGPYTVNILGFTKTGLNGQACDQSYNVAAVSTEYITEEDQTNQACLWAEITAPRADIGVTKSCEPFATQTPYYQIIVGNAGPGSAVQPQLSDTLPTGVTYKSYTSQLTNNGVTTNQGSCTYSSGSRVLSCQLLTPLPAGSPVNSPWWTVKVYVTVGAGSIVNTVTASSITTDNNSANNTMTTSCEPTDATLDYFTATGAKQSIILDWETLTESNNAGFNLYRATSLKARRTKLNDSIIMSGNLGGDEGAEYQYIDEGLKANRIYYYWLEAVDLGGAVTQYGPVDAKATR